MSDSTRHDSADAPTTAAGMALSSVRASHAERVATVERLHAALSEGRLGLDETEERVAAVYRSSYRSDLIPLLADLPAEPRGLRAGWAQVWQAIVRQAWVLLARVRGREPTDPSPGQQRAVTVVLVAGVFWGAPVPAGRLFCKRVLTAHSVKAMLMINHRSLRDAWHATSRTALATEICQVPPPGRPVTVGVGDRGGCAGWRCVPGPGSARGPAHR